MGSPFFYFLHIYFWRSDVPYLLGSSEGMKMPFSHKMSGGFDCSAAQHAFILLLDCPTFDVDIFLRRADRSLDFWPIHPSAFPICMILQNRGQIVRPQ